jgi:phosphoribosyl 1,2-cyclic phosphodiesterase
MEFKALASSSSGNAYILSDGGESIMIEAGIPWPKVQKAMDFQTGAIQACLVTHGHKDHSGYVGSVLRAGIDVYTPFDERFVGHHRIHFVPSDQQFGFTVGRWSIKSFPVKHDVVCVGYLIGRVSLEYGIERVLYLTDCLYSPFRFKGLAMILLGVNYSKDTISPDIEPAVRKHIIQGHMSLQTAIELLKANDLSRVREIWILHCSAQNSNAEMFKREIEKLTGKPTFVAAENACGAPNGRHDL